ncbi:unnamed protein product [Camellia sinensis]
MAALPQVAGRELSNPPSDGISNLRFSNHSDHLLVSSWDKSVRLYEASANVLRGEFMHGGPVLDCCFHDDSSGFSASADSTVRSDGAFDVSGLFSAQARRIFWESTMHLYAVLNTRMQQRQVITGSWDKTIKCWDPRGASGQERTLVGTYTQPERVYSLSLVGNRLVVATAGRHVNIYDLRNMSQPEQRRESSLKYQTRCVRCYPNGTGYALSSVEGRVAMEFFDLSEAGQSKKSTLPTARITMIFDHMTMKREIFFHYNFFFGTFITDIPKNNQGIHYNLMICIQVSSKVRSWKGHCLPSKCHCISPDLIYGTFATGGCDGYVNVWDGNNKKRLYQYSKYPTSVAALSFSRDGRLLAVASSYTFEEGDKPHEPDAIFVRSVNEVEVKPKPKAYPNPTT